VNFPRLAGTGLDSGPEDDKSWFTDFWYKSAVCRHGAKRRVTIRAAVRATIAHAMALGECDKLVETVVFPFRPPEEPGRSEEAQVRHLDPLHAWRPKPGRNE
jgi:hypothetical protein